MDDPDGAEARLVPEGARDERIALAREQLRIERRLDGWEGDAPVIGSIEEILVVERRLLEEEILSRRSRRLERQRPARESARLGSEVAEVETLQQA
jgi:hypothetical protein